jgi:hypothetical protein
VTDGAQPEAEDEPGEDDGLSDEDEREDEPLLGTPPIEPPPER